MRSVQLPRRSSKPSASMTMAFALVALTAVNLGVVMPREREAPRSSPLFPYFGWIFVGWMLTWAAVELPMLQRALGTVSLTGDQWAIVVALSLVVPVLVWSDKTITSWHNRRDDTTPPVDVLPMPGTMVSV